MAYESRFHIMVHVKWPSPSFKVDLDHENDNIMKNGFYQRILQPSEHPKRMGAKFFYFFKTLLDGPLILFIAIMPFSATARISTLSNKRNLANWFTKFILRLT